MILRNVHLTGLSPFQPRFTSSLRLLQHTHLREPSAPAGLVRYDIADAVQSAHRAAFLTWKAQPSGVPPPPRLLSFEAHPVFTLGRRQEELSPAQRAVLERPLAIGDAQLRPDVRKTSRGGLTTYHGPGQLVLWPVVDMHSPLHARLGVASYADLLMETTRRLLKEDFGVEAFADRDEPGLWTGEARASKIAAMGVHHRRHVTALGIALNVHVCIQGGEDVNPWARFVPCGLEDKAVTSVEKEVGGGKRDLEQLARRWAAVFEEALLG